ncbi:hypothetical protein L3X38_003464 [Prunus dulcis]|uniref:Uncharacterized protein n=1 Tax=Prunus dulcis TaxID=3755 RepID=A0AAD4ZM51_PRUDU|nr:hypothetical protein L3X38_003464 [Prunus dulcis]
MMRKYEMTNLGLLYHFLRMVVIQTEHRIFISRKKYALTLLNKFGLHQCKPVSIPLVTSEKLCKNDGSEPTDDNQYRQVVGSLFHLTAVRPDIMFASSLLARFMHCPTKKHYGTAKGVLSGVFSWASVKQHSVALSTAEAEYVSASETTTHAIWLRFVLEDFGELQAEATPLMVDNTFAIAMTRNPIFHQKTKHINSRYHFIRDALQEGVVDLRYCKSEEQVADIFTKALPKDWFNYLRGLLGVKPVNNLERNQLSCAYFQNLIIADVRSFEPPNSDVNWSNAVGGQGGGRGKKPQGEGHKIEYHMKRTSQSNIYKNTITATKGESNVGFSNFNNLVVDCSNGGQGQGSREFEGICHNIDSNEITADTRSTKVGVENFGNIIYNCETTSTKDHGKAACDSSSAQGQGGSGGNKPKGDSLNIRCNNINRDRVPKA